MIVGNQENRETLKKYIDMVFAGDPKAPHFIIVSWPQHIGKTTIITEILKEKMGNYFVTDVLHIKDFSEQLEKKKHTLKIEYKPNTEISKILLKEQNYEDIGVREINTRIQQSAIGKYKIVFIENMERMTNEAANAFLKTCEEPLPKRLIIATTSNHLQLLETILSRALMIKFNELNNKYLIERMNGNNMFSNEEVRQLVTNMAMGKPGIAQRMFTLTQEDEELAKTLTDLIHNLSTDKNKFKAHDALKKIYKYGILEAFIDGRIAYCINNDMEEKGQKRLKTKKLMKTNVNIENLLLYWLLDN
jgi:DNA polymerase III delta prime subunit